MRSDTANWAGNVTYSSKRILRPRTIAEAQEHIAAEPAIRALGTRHSFSRVADAAGALLSTEHLNRVVEIGERSATVEAGVRYGELGVRLLEHGLAVPNYASLPHISVGGAIATATHGSGAANQSLASPVSAIDLVVADGSLRTIRRGDDDFDGAVVALGALGIVVRVTLDVVPAFELRQVVFEWLPWSAVDSSLAEILGGAYSVSLFTRWTPAGVEQVWVKSTDDHGGEYFGARAATGALNPVPGSSPENCTEQLGVPGPSGDRLPHFRLGFTPSGGDELQSEFIVAREHAAGVVGELRKLGPRITPLLLIGEIRAVAADSYWLSPFYERDSVAFHFTWKPLGAEVLALLPAIEDALAPFAPRPHWGKVFLRSPAEHYPKLPAFRALRERLDPAGTFGNDFLDAI
jgi:alditol oxidase